MMVRFQLACWLTHGHPTIRTYQRHMHGMGRAADGASHEHKSHISGSQPKVAEAKHLSALSCRSLRFGAPIHSNVMSNRSWVSFILPKYLGT